MAGIIRVASQALILPVLSRLLTPADYGMVAITMPFIAFSMAISDGGLCLSLVRRNETDARVWSSVFWCIAAAALVTSITLSALAPLLAALTSEPRLTFIMCALAMAFLLQALQTVPTAMIQRDHRFVASGSIEVASTLIGITTLLLLAFSGAGAWALVGQQLAFWVFRAITVWLFVKPSIRFEISLRSIRADVVFGWYLVRINAVNFASRYADAVLIGIFLGTSAAGFYNMAFQLMRLPATLLLGPANTVLFSAISKIQRVSPERAKPVYLSLTAILCGLLFPPMAVAAVAHGPIFDLLLSEKWAEAGVVFSLMAPAGAVQTVSLLSNPFLSAIGKPELQLRLTIEFTTVWVICLAIGISFGIVVVAALMNIAVAVYMFRFAQLALPALGCSAIDCLKVALPALAITAAVVVACSAAFLITPSELILLWVAGGLCLIGPALCLILYRSKFNDLGGLV